MHLGGAIMNLGNEKYQRGSRTLEPNMLFYFTINQGSVKRAGLQMSFCVENQNQTLSFSLNITETHHQNITV